MALVHNQESQIDQESHHASGNTDSTIESTPNHSPEQTRRNIERWYRNNVEIARHGIEDINRDQQHIEARLAGLDAMLQTHFSQILQFKQNLDTIDQRIKDFRQQPGGEDAPALEWCISLRDDMLQEYNHLIERWNNQQKKVCSFEPLTPR